MKHCPITYQPIHENETYSQRGLKLLSPQLTTLTPLAFSAAQLREEALARVGKMSVQGVQLKLSAVLKIKEHRFELVDRGGRYILKPPSEYYPELPENEALTMSLASVIGIEVPVHGLLYSKDNNLTYFIKRFDRIGHQGKLATEDFAQLLQLRRDTKYDSSMERVASVIEACCSFPKIEFAALLKRTLFNYLIGNEDMHLKNFSLITQKGKVTLAPAYDFLNTTIAQKNTKEELALPLNGKKNNLKKSDFIDYFAFKRLQLPPAAVVEILQSIKTALPQWQQLIENSLLSESMRMAYLRLLEERCRRLELV